MTKSDVFFFFHSAYVIDLFFLVSNSADLSLNARWFRFYGILRWAVGAKNGPKVGQKCSVLTRILKKNDFQIATPP